MVCVAPPTTPPMAGSNTMLKPSPAAAGIALTLVQVCPPFVVTYRPFDGVPT